MGLVAVPNDVNCEPVAASPDSPRADMYTIMGNSCTISLAELQEALLERGIMIAPRGTGKKDTYILRKIPSWLILGRLATVCERIKKGK